MKIDEEFFEGILPKIKPTRKKGINSKKKGNSFELQIAKLLTKRFGKKFQRTFFSGAFTGGTNVSRSETMTEEQKLMVVGDINVPKEFLFSIECKARKEAAFWDLFNKSSEIFQWFNQAINDANKVKKFPMIIVKYNNKEPLCFTPVNFETHKYFMIDIWNCFLLKDVLALQDKYFFE